MNKIEFPGLIASFIRKSTEIQDNFICKGVTSNLQEAMDGDIVFYKISEQKRAKKIFIDRLSKAGKCFLILNQIPPEINDRPNTISIEISSFPEVEKRILDIFYPLDKKKLKIVGVTGTNGKTTVVNLARKISLQMGKRAASLGTLGYIDEDGNQELASGNTTPSYIEIRKILNSIQNRMDVIFMEVSSHALSQGRLGDICFDQCAWTSFSQDHLDYHADMNEYFNAKIKLLNMHLSTDGVCLVPPGERSLIDKLMDSCPDRIELVATIAERNLENQLPGHLDTCFNRSNLELALGICEKLWNELGEINFKNLRPPKGRFSQINVGDGVVIIDYAHTPDALENICSAIRKDFKRRKFTVLFGCGGNRDRGKRPQMGQVAMKYADRIIVTSDNPRFESPMDIISDIVAGMDNKNGVMIIENRKQAILEALGSMSTSEILLLAGKGHEIYQDIDGKKNKFSEFDIVNEFKKSCSNG
ncbi:MAG: UDP-N-acetylmuramoyl-L-alanyl-D-glutamate--2,6-diaminopimelate ligase [Bacteriovoracaceae bacterium]|nr:UDP-N-acetylmuramoyl-L-alanyl-D-glutamate--2,6-diaminopimelate ligase [Bacteriovoracaceae bacterium]